MDEGESRERGSLGEAPLNGMVKVNHLCMPGFYDQKQNQNQNAILSTLGEKNCQKIPGQMRWKENFCQKRFFGGWSGRPLGLVPKEEFVT